MSFLSFCPQASFYSTALKTLISVSTVILLGLIVAYHALEVQVIIFPIITTTLVQYTPNNSRSNHVSQKNDNNVLKTLCQPDLLAKQLNKTNLMKISKFTPRQRLQRDVGTLPNINLASPKLTHAPEGKKQAQITWDSSPSPGKWSKSGSGICIEEVLAKARVQ